jgi:hypothetical protein
VTNKCPKSVSFALTKLSSGCGDHARPLDREHAQASLAETRPSGEKSREMGFKAHAADRRLRSPDALRPPPHFTEASQSIEVYGSVFADGSRNKASLNVVRAKPAWRS